jgi:hypothetical protein
MSKSLLFLSFRKERFFFFAKKKQKTLVCLGLLLCGTRGAVGRQVDVATTPALIAAVAGAHAGDDIVLADGTYVISSHLNAMAAGTAQAPISVRAAHKWQARILSSAQVVFEITGPDWHFLGLDIRGVCAQDSYCEHAFHVVGAADGFMLSGNRLVDFNAQLKVNANAAHAMPAHGLVENNLIFDTHARHTDNPVAPLDMDNTLYWVARGNFIYDFQKDGTDEIAYGAYFKGGTVAPVFDRNLVMCSRYVSPVGQAVGLALGAGGMDRRLCSPHWNDTACDPEVDGGIVRNNIVVNCSDEGIYLNNARQSQILFNTLAFTNGIEFRFAGSNGQARGNVLSGPITTRDGGAFAGTGNVQNLSFPDWYRAPGAGDFRLRTAIPAMIRGAGGVDAAVANDFCGRPRTGRLDAGALQSSLGDCSTLPDNNSR